MISLVILAREIHRSTRKNDAAIFSGRYAQFNSVVKLASC